MKNLHFPIRPEWHHWIADKWWMRQVDAIKKLNQSLCEIFKSTWSNDLLQIDCDSELSEESYFHPPWGCWDVYQTRPSEEFTQTRAAFMLRSLNWLPLDVCLRLQDSKEVDRGVLHCDCNECSTDGTRKRKMPRLTSSLHPVNTLMSPCWLNINNRFVPWNHNVIHVVKWIKKREINQLWSVVN